MSWPGTDFECEIQTEIDNLRALAKAVGVLIDANDASNGLNRPRPDIAWRDVKKAHLEWLSGDKGDI